VYTYTQCGALLEFPLINSFNIAAASLLLSSAGKQLAAWQQYRCAQSRTEQYETEASGTWCFFTAIAVVSCTVLPPTTNCISNIAALLSPSLLGIFSLLRCTRVFLFSLSCLLFYFSSILYYILFHQVYMSTLFPLYLSFYVFFPYLNCFSLLFQCKKYFLSNSTIDPIFFAVALRPNVGHGFILEVSRSNTMTHHSR
jgi:hypothetical protein